MHKARGSFLVDIADGSKEAEGGRPCPHTGRHEHLVAETLLFPLTLKPHGHMFAPLELDPNLGFKLLRYRVNVLQCRGRQLRVRCESLRALILASLSPSTHLELHEVDTHSHGHGIFGLDDILPEGQARAQWGGRLAGAQQGRGRTPILPAQPLAALGDRGGTLHIDRWDYFAHY